MRITIAELEAMIRPPKGSYSLTLARPNTRHATLPPPEKRGPFIRCNSKRRRKLERYLKEQHLPKLTILAVQDREGILIVRAANEVIAQLAKCPHLVSKIEAN